MANKYFNRNGLAAQYQHYFTEAVAAQGRCQGRMSPEAYRAAQGQLDETRGYPTPEERLSFWLGVEAGLEDGGVEQAHDEATRKTIYEMAKSTIENRQQWPSGHSETVWSGGRHSAELKEGGRDGGGLLYLVFRNGKPGQETRVTAGMLNPLKGWVFTLTDAQYQWWVSKACKTAKG
ncbi:MAG: hypothetical protein ACYTEQ_30440 [Planctomycetota bacterium]|jgi:hypothetical protein